MSTPRKKIRLHLRPPEDFNACAEATLGNDIKKWRATEALEANPCIGQIMKDGSIYGGIIPKTGQKVFAAPQDAGISMSFDAAVEYARNLNEEKYLGHDDWKIPRAVELRQIFHNRKAGAFEGTFRELRFKRYANYYWLYTNPDRCCNHTMDFKRGEASVESCSFEASVRAIRLG